MGCINRIFIVYIKIELKLKYEINQDIRYGAMYRTCMIDVLRYFKNEFRLNGFSISCLASNPYVICWENPRDGR